MAIFTGDSGRSGRSEGVGQWAMNWWRLNATRKFLICFLVKMVKQRFLKYRCLSHSLANTHKSTNWRQALNKAQSKEVNERHKLTTKIAQQQTTQARGKYHMRDNSEKQTKKQSPVTSRQSVTSDSFALLLGWCSARCFLADIWLVASWSTNALIAIELLCRSSRQILKNMLKW